MSVTITQFNEVLARLGSDVIYHREDGGEPCPCRTPEGFRSPSWHRGHPEAPECNEQAFLALTTEYAIKGVAQPAQTRYTRADQRANALLGEIQMDDRLGIFPCEWDGHVLNFDDWSDAGEDFIVYDNRRYVVVAADKLADVDGDPNHHWEVGLRLIKTERLSGALA